VGVEVTEEDLLRLGLSLRTGAARELLPHGVLGPRLGGERRSGARRPLDLARWAVGTPAGEKQTHYQ
jgi:hypothetical protein